MTTATIGILGGGQLGRMLALAGYPLAMRFRIYEPSPEACAGVLATHHQGEYDDWDALKRFADGMDVVTYEFENVPLETARFLQQFAPVYPPPLALETAQERLTEKTFFRTQGIPTPEFAAVTTAEELRAAVEQIGLPSVLKTCRMGYDGKGQFVLKTADEVESMAEKLDGTPFILEQFIPFDREVSLIGARRGDGMTAFYPLTQNHHRDGILRQSLAPAPSLTDALQAEAEEYLRRMMNALDYVGVLAVEFFEKDGHLVANEMAPRVHNSGHWTQNAGCISQFENHLRAIAGLPLGETLPNVLSVMVNCIGTLPDMASLLTVPGAFLHLYGKDPKPGRKIGHINLTVAEEAEREMLLQGLSII